MANCCINIVRISGDKEQVKEFKELVGKEFDFNKVIPIETNSREESLEKWGCSSNAYDVIFEEKNATESEATWVFITSWTPPRYIYQVLRDKFPDIFIYWRYEEPLMDLYGFLQKDEDI